MDRDFSQFRPQQGMSVYGSDGDKVGEVDTVEQDYFVVRKGFFFPEDHYIPVNAISNADEGNIYLNYTKDQVLEQEWTAAPVNTDPATTGNYNAADAQSVDTGTSAAAGDALDRDVAERDETNISVHEEDLVARRRDVDRGDVEITKNVVEEEQSIDVPVTEERVEVTRRAVDRDVAPDEVAFEEGTIDVPVHGEEVDVEKRARVTEEIDVDKVAEQHTERVSDTVRREEVTIDGEEVDRNKDRKRRR